MITILNSFFFSKKGILFVLNISIKKEEFSSTHLQLHHIYCHYPVLSSGRGCAKKSRDLASNMAKPSAGKKETFAHY
jgi:hypothetical protein